LLSAIDCAGKPAALRDQVLRAGLGDDRDIGGFAAGQPFLKLQRGPEGELKPIARFVLEGWPKLFEHRFHRGGAQNSHVAFVRQRHLPFRRSGADW